VCGGSRSRRRGPAGVNLLTLSTVKSIFPVLANPLNGYSGLVPLSAAPSHFVFTNELDEADSHKDWAESGIPGSAHVLWQGALAGLGSHGDGEVDWKKGDRAPSLLIAGSNDHIVPLKVAEAVLDKYNDGASGDGVDDMGGGEGLVEYNEFGGRAHHIFGQKEWEEVAERYLK
jgi:non-heme chloroperoxidase